MIKPEKPRKDKKLSHRVKIEDYCSLQSAIDRIKHKEVPFTEIILEKEFETRYGVEYCDIYFCYYRVPTEEEYAKALAEYKRRLKEYREWFKKNKEVLEQINAAQAKVNELTKEIRETKMKLNTD